MIKYLQQFKYFCIILILCLVQNVNGQNTLPEKGIRTVINIEEFKTKSLNSVQSDGMIRAFKTLFPNQNGIYAEVSFDEILISSSKIPGITTLNGTSTDKSIIYRLTLLKEGIEGIMKTPEGYFFIEPSDENPNEYIIYAMSDTDVDKIKCGVEGNFEIKTNSGRVLSESHFPVGSALRVYDMAAAATGEFVTHFGNQATALAKIVSVMNAANLIYELEASVRFQLIAATTNYTILFTNASSDPFSPNTTFADAEASQTGFNTMNSNGTLSYSSYDVGHTFNIYQHFDSQGNPLISSRGQAGPNPCIDAEKSRGWTEWSHVATLPTYLSMVVSVFVHEVGHQFTAFHTYNAVGGTANNATFCLNGWSPTDAIEPGSGTTLMSYANNCINPTNFTITGNNKLNYFNTKSLEKIYNYVANSATCFTSSATGNTPPVAGAGTDITIPKGTPFKLNGTATDANGDAMSYTWDQYDVATANDKGALGTSIAGAGGYTAVNSTTAPLFRSEQSSSSTERTFPKLTYILNNANNPADNEGEDLPQVARTMKFRFTVRDNKSGGGGVDSDEVTVNVVNSGPFQITSQNTATLWFYNGTNTANITWDVNGTNAAPLNTTNVKISFSTDGGQTFPTVLIASTPNDGSHTITIPNNVTSQGRIKIEAIGNVYFDINDVNITIGTSCSPESSSINPTTAVSAEAGSATLNLGLSKSGAAISSFSGNIATSDPATSLVLNNGSGSCINYGGNATYYDVFTFYVSTAGSYTFTKTSGAFGLVQNLYNGIYDPNSPCTNWMESSYSGNITKTLPVGQYYLVITGYSASLPASYPSAYVYSVSPAVSSLVPAEGSPYSYTFLVKDNNSSTIKGFSANADLTNSSTYNTGLYTVYGLSYQGGLDLTPYIGTSFSAFQTLLGNNTICGVLSSNSKSVTITGCSAPAAPTTVAGSRCGTGTVNLSASGCTGGTYNWYAASTGGTSLGTSGNFTTPSISTTTTYYVDCTVSGCTSTRSSAVATVTIVDAPVTYDNSRCGSGSVFLYTTGCIGGTINWFTSNSGGTSIHTGFSYSPSLATTTTFYVDCTISGCTSTTRSSVVGTINTLAPVPTISNSTCLTSPATLTASGCTGGTIEWYDSSEEFISSGNSLTGITTPGTYYAVCVVGDCDNFTSVNVTLKPSTPTISPVTISSGQTATLTASGCSGGTVNWFAASSGGTSLGTGTTYTTPALTSTTTYYADCTVGTCTSATRGSGVVTVTTEPPCATRTYNLVSTANDITTGTHKFEAGLEITATNKVTGGNVKYDSGKSITLNPGFKVDNGAVFTAYIDGCGNQ